MDLVRALPSARVATTGRARGGMGAVRGSRGGYGARDGGSKGLILGRGDAEATTRTASRDSRSRDHLSSRVEGFLQTPRAPLTQHGLVTAPNML